MKRDHELPPDLRVDFFVYKDDGLWVAHCIQLDIVAAEPDRKDAIQECAETCSEHLAFALTTGRLGSVFKMAPPEVVEQFIHGRRMGTMTIPLMFGDDEVRESEGRRVDIQEVAAEGGAEC